MPVDSEAIPHLSVHTASNSIQMCIRDRHVLKGTPLADMYIKQPFELFTLDDYCDFVVDCIELSLIHICCTVHISRVL